MNYNNIFHRYQYNIAQLCRPGYWGDAVTPGAGCRSCACYGPGSATDPRTGEAACDGDTGQCTCKDHVTGARCDT